jgi:hypothetical protein
MMTSALSIFEAGAYRKNLYTLAAPTNNVTDTSPLHFENPTILVLQRLTITAKHLKYYTIN